MHLNSVHNGQDLRLGAGSATPPPRLLLGLFGTLMFYNDVTSNAMQPLAAVAHTTELLRQGGWVRCMAGHTLHHLASWITRCLLPESPAAKRMSKQCSCRPTWNSHFELWHEANLNHVQPPATCPCSSQTMELHLPGHSTWLIRYFHSSLYLLGDFEIGVLMCA
jgi:hypothetical protein